MKGRLDNRFRMHVVKTALKRRLFPNTRYVRSEAGVREVYGENYDRETNDFFMHNLQDTFINGKKALYPVVLHKRFLMESFADRLRPFSPSSILELGSGRGYNLMALAVLLPDVKEFQGIELTRSGVETAQRNRKNPSLSILAQMTGFSEREVGERLAGRLIDYREGSIRALPFSDKSYDAVFSNSVIEQIPRDYLQVFEEASRVAKKVGMFSEPFAEAQKGEPIKMMHLRNIDYFCASYTEIEKAGWTIFSYEPALIQKYVFNTGFLTAFPKEDRTR
ncbi:MAG: class I SAM-dependent methyltransferase [Patescibacteria group bacterium]